MLSIAGCGELDKSGAICTTRAYSRESEAVQLYRVEAHQVGGD
jgi:hypothetical protein